MRVRGGPLLDALEQHQPGAHEHAEAVGSYAFAAAVSLGMNRAEAELCREAAKLHEIGRLYEPDDYHEPGASLALGAGIPDEVCGWLLQARERFDGGGPEGLTGTAIPAPARITRAACVCDTALSAPDVSSAADGRRRATDALLAGAGKELDPGVVAALVSVLERAEGS